MEFVETDRLIMRRWNEDDASALFKYAELLSGGVDKEHLYKLISD